MEVERVADMELDMVADHQKKTTSTWKSNLVRELITGLVNWAQNFRPKDYPACAFSKRCELIFSS